MSDEKMSDEKQKLLVIGMGSQSDMKNVNAVTLGGKTIDAYFADNGIKVYRHPKTGEYLVTSIHRTTMESIMWAHDLQRLVVDEGHKVAAVLYGGLALALPGVVASEAPSVPVIGIGSDIDAFWNVYKIPDGNTCATVPIGNLEHGLGMAGKILDYDGTSVQLVAAGNCPNADAVRSVLDINKVAYECIEDNGERKYDGLVVGIAETLGHLISLDERVQFGILGFEKSVKSQAMANAMELPGAIHNSVVVGRPKNLGYFAAKVVGLNDSAIAKGLFGIRVEEAQKYPPHIRMELEHFGGGE